jgi:hypothetical protein
MGFFAGYYYFFFSSAYQHNPNPVVTIDGGYVGMICSTNTILWLLINIPFVCMVAVIYRSHPFKGKIYENWPITAIAIANLIAGIAFFFITSKLGKMFGLVSIPAY